MEFNGNPFDRYAKDWALVTAGTAEHFNSMTIGWGGFGTLWGKSVITIYVRPERYTHGFLSNSEYFTVSFYEESYRPQLQLFGTKSGRDLDKAEACGFTPVVTDCGITYRQAKETYFCRKIYTQDMDKSGFPESALHYYGENGQPHTMFVGEIIRKL